MIVRPLLIKGYHSLLKSRKALIENGVIFLYYAHYDRNTDYKQLLSDHLTAVSDLAEINIPSSVQFEELSYVDIRNIAKYIGLYHDLGKYLKLFQDYLLSGKGKNSDEKNHAHISAIYIYNFTCSLLEKTNLLVESSRRHFIAFIAYLSVRQHHSSLSLNGVDNLSEHSWGVLEKQAKELQSKAKDILTDNNWNTLMISEHFQNLLNLYRTKSPLFLRSPQQLRSKFKSDFWYFLWIYLFSLLIDYDKLDSAELTQISLLTIAPSVVTKYLKSKHPNLDDTELIRNREKARLTMLNTVEQLSNEEIKDLRFFTITAPTGIGKTLSSLQCALKLRERIKEIEGFTPRIITAIPFINIIEQTQEDYESVLAGENKLIVHHRLADFNKHQETSAEEMPLDKSLLQVEAWEGDVILTTFVQLFQSLLTGRNRQLKKINKLAGSIVILDEVQAIPDEYLALIGALLRKIADYYGTTFILMTATQPKILELGDLLLEQSKSKSNPLTTAYISSKELLTNHKTYFEKLNRTKFVPFIRNEQSTGSFVEFSFKTWKKEKSVLIVVNTIKRSIDVYKKIREKLLTLKIKASVFYLSTNIIPLQRKDVISKVEGLLTKRESHQDIPPVILVSTQTIEAGVDLDFDMGFRDLAPITSLIQTAGRINRKGSKGDNLPIYIVKFERDSSNVYKLHNIDITNNLIQGFEEIPECNYRNLIERYYKSLLDIGVSQKSVDLWQDGILGLNFEEINKFSLIEDIGDVTDVFIETNKDKYQSNGESTLLANAYEALLDFRNPIDLNILKAISIIPSDSKKEISIFQRKVLLRIISARMSLYSVQVRASRLRENRPIDFSARNGIKSPMYWVPSTQIKQFYDADTGFKDSGDAYLY